jgi:hypothetical protein
MPRQDRNLARLAFVITSLAIVGVLTACTGQAASNSSKTGAQPQFEGGTGVLAEYQKTVADFPFSLPKGVTFPASPPSSYLKGQSQLGVGLGPAYFYWLCSWEADYLKADGANNAKGSATALAEVAKWPSTTFAKTYVIDPDNNWYKAVVDPAKLGDPSGVSEDMQGEGCAALGVASP